MSFEMHGSADPAAIKQTRFGTPRLRFGRAAAFCTLGALAMLTGACSMAGSGMIDGVTAQTCHSDAGHYYLSRTYLQVKIEKHDIENEAPQYFISEEGIKILHLPDKSAPFCIDYLASRSSDDMIVVERDNGLLKKITTNAEDKSVPIAKTLIKALFAGISQNPAFNVNTPGARALGAPRLQGGKEFEALYDPFDDAQVANINHVIKDFGFCLILADHVPDRHIESYCSNPLGHRSREHLILASTSDDITPIVGGHAHLKQRHLSHETAESWADNTDCRRAGVKDADIHGCEAIEDLKGPPIYSEGIFYRARLPYSFYVYVRPNLKVMGGWQLRGVETVELENESPVFNVAVDRTYFANRKTTLTFDKGVLQDVSIDKGSELAGFVQIPLVLAQSIVALPTNVVQVRIDLNNSKKNLIEAQSELIALKERQKINRDALNEAAAGRKTGRSMRSLSNTSFGDGGGDAGADQSFAPDAGITLAQNVYYQQCYARCTMDDVACGKICTCESDCASRGYTGLSCTETCRNSQ